MNILQADVPGARVIDLFAGTGALGLEALSRGAVHADFVEQDPEATRVLIGNIEALGAAGHCTVHRADVFRVLDECRPPSDIAFADPPYRKDLAVRVAECWLASPFAAILGVEHESITTLPEGGDTRRYGDTAITIYRR